MRYAIVLALILSVPAMLAKPQGQAARKIPCKTPANAPMCYWTRGRFQYYNGTPSYRLWKIGTRRLLGVYSGPSVWTGDPAIRDNEDPELPAEVTKLYSSPFGQVFADFEVCPLEPERAGFMQAVCIESAKNIYVRKP
jgi:hypothetical protein